MIGTLVLITCILSCVQGRSTGLPTEGINQPFKKCGKALDQILHLVCDGKYASNDLDTNGRSKRALRDGGVVDECCHRECTFVDLAKYCEGAPSQSYLLNMQRQPEKSTTTEKATTLPLKLDNEIIKKTSQRPNYQEGSVTQRKFGGGVGNQQLQH